MKILVAYIATAGGRDAVALGITLARTFDVTGAGTTELQICVVVPPEPPNPNAKIEHLAGTLDAAAHGWLDEAAALAPEDITPKKRVVVHANPAGGLIEYAEQTRTDVLVIGGSGGGIVGRHTLGTVVNDVLHSSPVPVALAPLGFSHTGPTRIGAVTAALGTRSGASHFIETIAEFCGAGGLPLRLVSLVALDDMDQHQSGGCDTAVAHARRHIETTRADSTERLVTSGAQATVMSTAVVQGESIEDAVAGLEWAADDLIVVGSSRLAAPNRIFLGTTAAKMLRVVAAPMIVVPSSP